MTSTDLTIPILARFEVLAAVTQVSWNCRISSRHFSATVVSASSLSLSTSLSKSSRNSSLPCKMASRCDLVRMFQRMIGVMKKTACVNETNTLYMTISCGIIKKRFSSSLLPCKMASRWDLIRRFQRMIGVMKKTACVNKTSI